MSKNTKHILCGIGGFAFVIVTLPLIRSLIKGVPVADGFKDWTNWVLAAVSGVCTFFSASKKDAEKEEREKKDKE